MVSALSGCPSHAGQSMRSTLLVKRLVTPEALDPLFHIHDPCNLVAQPQRRNDGNQQDVSHLDNWRLPLESFALFGCERMERGGSRTDRSQNSVTPYSAEEVDLQQNARGVVGVEPWHTGSQGQGVFQLPTRNSQKYHQE